MGRVPGAFEDEHEGVDVLVLHFSLTSTTSTIARHLVEALGSRTDHLRPTSAALVEHDLDALLFRPSTSGQQLCLFLVPSYNVETALDSALAQIRDVFTDFRVSRDALKHLCFAVLGVGHSDYGGEQYGMQAKELDRMLGGLGAKRVARMGVADCKTDPERDARRWTEDLLEVIGRPDVALSDAHPVEVDVDPESESEEEEPVSKAAIAKRRARARRRTDDKEVDIEELGASLPSMGPEGKGTKDMVSPLTRKTLTKQGYALVGSHSGVKTCRWTKASLRGRGFCYKNAFYGIQSHRCMEATPSLACANKCTFCWRSHSNPVGTSWRWNTDDPDFVVSQSLAEHDRLIKQLAGMPGVRPDRFDEARTPKHAALSLVGEPVMYPHIHRYIRLLTEKGISTFLVTNAQFPESLEDLPPVTQLYLSIDAGTKDSLKAIDRPLHRDFWERFLASIDIVRRRRVRSVFRLTLVKDRNSSPSDLEAYAGLIRRGRPDFIEVKGVTFCGYGGSSGLSMKNSPYHDEVREFVEALCEKLEGAYGCAAEHRHSCCVLAARSEYRVDGQWWTWIDYPRFFELAAKGEPFKGLDYAAPTPDWAVYGAPEAGFSPEDERWFRKKA